ncbi:MAG: glycoside hydrolase family 3 C-terminal domain-containing protein [Alphaproteobacteria bacterium]|nr:glycoside hydrolase family 3 C-terminal domain-containing protein [Alphaproteobacteria bacterium]
MRDLEALVDDMTLEEQVSLLSGRDSWSVPGIARFGFGPIKVTDGPNGARGGGSLIGGITAAAFPIGIALGATWNTDIVGEIGAALADEVRSKDARVLLAPTVNIQRSVTNGRNFECYSEDPILTARLASAYIAGLQGKGVAATIKHFAGNESEIERTTASSEIEERSLREVYLVPFEAAVKSAGTFAVMSAYNKVNGTYAAENRWLLTKVLREDWGYDGIVMSDWFGSRTTAPTINAGLDLEMPGPTRDRGQKLIDAVARGEVAPETVRASALRMLRLFARTGALDATAEQPERADDRQEHRALIRRAGADAMVLLKNSGVLPLDPAAAGKIAVIGPNARTARIMGGGSAQINPHYSVSPWDGLVAVLGDDRLSYARGCTNHRFEDVIKAGFKAEYFANETFAGDPVHVGEFPAAHAFFNDTVAEGKVDWRHFSARFTGRYLAVETRTHRVGGYAAGYMKVFVDGRLAIDASAGKWIKGRTFFEEGCDEVVAELALEAGRSYEIVIELTPKPYDNLIFTAFAVGIGAVLGDEAIAEAARIAAEAEIALVFVGRSGEWDTEGSDLNGIALPGRQDELVAAVAAANPKTIVVLQTGGPVEMPWLGAVTGLVEAWYPGQELGNAVADVLTGAAEPGGRLPQSFPVKWADNPTQSQDRQVYPGLDGKVRYEEGVFVGYRHYDRAGIDPLFPFGFGLSYTRFEMTGIEVENLMESEGVVRVHAGLRNTGARSGSTVIQIYVGDEQASVPRPVKELKAFVKIVLDANDGCTVSLDLRPRDFAFFDVVAQCWRIEAGTFEILCGFSAADIQASWKIALEAATIAVGDPL